MAGYDERKVLFNAVEECLERLIGAQSLFGYGGHVYARIFPHEKETRIYVGIEVYWCFNSLMYIHFSVQGRASPKC